MYDYLIVGSGLFGSTFANLATNNGKSCLILGGRLACYRYFDMHQSIGQAMKKFEEQYH